MRLPPLNALRAFEAAARYEGFIGASEELHVTRGAISRHVKQLEAHMGVALFTRQAQGVRLTEAGRRLLPVLTDAFEAIAEEIARIAQDATELRVICPPGTSIRWLIPKLSDFQLLHPEIRLQLTTDFFEHRESLQNYDIAFSVEHVPERKLKLKTLPLFPIYLTPACAPKLLKTGLRLSKPEDLAQTLLLHETPRHADWAAWLDAFDVAGVDPASGHDFPNLDMAMKAAVMGTGVVMADLVLSQEELASGSLVAPFPDKICQSPYGTVCLLGAAEHWDLPKVVAFRDWAYKAAAQDRNALAASPVEQLSLGGAPV